MGSRTINLSELAGAIEANTLKDVESMKRAVASGLAASIPMLVERSPVDTGLYAQSWNFTVSEETAIIGNYAPHAAIIEHGARPFSPPIGPLLQWAKRVLKDPSQPPKYSDAVWALAIGTKNKIKAVGIKPKHIMQKSIPDIIDLIKREFAKELEKK